MLNLPKIVVLTGAGISAESGIKTFRADNGLWEEHKVEDVATPKGFLKNPQLVQNFYNELRKKLHQKDMKPNLAHQVLAEFEKFYIDNNCTNKFLLVTQNIDNLHQRAGSKNIISMHGELFKVRCVNTNKVFAWEKDILPKDKCECCNNFNTLRPHIVWFEEMPLGMSQIFAAIQKADYFIAIGTSGNVYPAAGFVAEANLAGAHSVELNLQPSITNTQFIEKLYGKATEIVPVYFKRLKQKLDSKIKDM